MSQFIDITNMTEAELVALLATHSNLSEAELGELLVEIDDETELVACADEWATTGAAA